MNKPKNLVCIAAVLITFLWAGSASAETEEIRAILLNGVAANFSGDYDRASEIFSSISEIDPDHPSREFYQAVVLFWKNSVAETRPASVDLIRAHLNTSIGQSGRRLAIDKNDPDALHYLGLAYTYLGRLEAHHGNIYKGGVFGERGRKYLEKAIAICDHQNGPESEPDAAHCRSCADLYFPLGAYSYFAGRLPQFLQAVNFLWFIPSGSAKEGLDDLERAYALSDLHRLGAQSLLADIFLTFENSRLHDGQKLSQDLIRRFPDNPYLEIQHAAFLMAAGKNQLAAENAEKIIKKVQSGLRNYDGAVRQRALLIKAEAAIRGQNAAAAKEILNRLKNDPAYQGNSLAPHADLLLGMMADIEMKHEKAARFYEQARSYKGAQHNRFVARKAKEYLKEPFNISGSGSS